MAYSRADLFQAVQGRCYNKLGILPNYEVTLNNAAREVFSEIDLRSSKRKFSTPSQLLTDIYQYPCPTDMKGQNIIDLQPQLQRSMGSQWQLTTQEEFDRTKGMRNAIAFADNSMLRTLLVSGNDFSGDNIWYWDSPLSPNNLNSNFLIDNGNTGARTLVLSYLTSLTQAGATWTAFGDAENLRIDNQNFIKGNGSMEFDINGTGGTTAGVYINGMQPIDISDYDNGLGYYWVYLTSSVGVTNLKMRLGTGIADYMEMTATTQADGTAFTAGWNLVNPTNATVTGTPNLSAVTYMALFMTKDITKINETQYRLNWLVLKTGNYYSTMYYSKYPWQSSTGTWKENSTADQDLLNVDADEYYMIVEKAVQLASMELSEDNNAETARVRYEGPNGDGGMKANYKKLYKSERMRPTTTRYRFSTIINS